MEAEERQLLRRRSRLAVALSYLVLLDRAHDETVGVLLSSFHVAESNAILVRYSLGFGPSDVSNSLAQESNHERILTLDLERVSGEKLRYPVVRQPRARSGSEVRGSVRSF